MHITQIDQIEDLAPYRGQWQGLLRDTPGATFFQSLEWLEVYWKHFGAEQKLRVLMVHQGGDLIGIMPLVVRTEHTKLGNLRFLTYPLDYWGSYYGPIGTVPAIILNAGLSHLRRQKRDWDVLELRWVGHDDNDCQATSATLRQHGLSAVRTVIDQTALIELTGDFDSYWAGRTSKWRNNYRRWLRRMKSDGNLELLRYRPAGTSAGDDDPRWDLFDACQQVARQSWQSESSNGTTICHDSIRGFIRGAHAAATRSGALDLNLLMLNDAPIAFAYNYRMRDTVYGLRIGFDPRYRRNGPGNLLYGMIVEDSYRRGDRRYDLGPGSLDCKRCFQTKIQNIYRYTSFPVFAIRPQLLHVKRLLDARAGASETS